MNSYLARLIDRATDVNLDLENNRIGNYRITPQHGSLIKVYHIYKDRCHSLTSGNKRKYDNIHVSSISMDFSRVDIQLSKQYLTVKEQEDIIDCINNLYGSSHDINIETLH